MIRSWVPAVLAAIALTAASAAQADPLASVSPRSGYGYQTGGGNWVGTPPPYGPGFGYGVVIEPGRDCSGAGCQDFTNRPGYRRYYHHYFDVPQPSYGERRVAPRTSFRLAAPHVEWCMDRYRSYRAADNSWKPSGQPRRQCTSPYL